MADMELTDDNEEGKPVEGSQFKKILMLALPIVLVAALAMGAYFSGVVDSFFSVKDAGNESKNGETAGEKMSPNFFEVPEMLVNLSVRQGQKPIYFKIKIVLDLANELDAPKVEKMLPRVIDSLQFYLREMRLEELQGSMGTYRLKEELTNRLNKVLSPVQVNDVLLKEVLIQ